MTSNHYPAHPDEHPGDPSNYTDGELELPADSRRIENAADARHRLVRPAKGGKVWRVMLRVPGTSIYKLQRKRGQYRHSSAAELEEGWVYAD